MSGFAGIVIPEGSSSILQRLNRALEALAHRGPDDSASLLLRCHAGQISVAEEKLECADAELEFPTASPQAIDGATAEPSLIALGQRTLSTIHHSPPTGRLTSTPDGRIFILYDGEIYNYPELGKELEALGHTFLSHSDTEVLLAAFRQWGGECLRKLIGMFSFAVLDVAQRLLFLARDFFGAKPLYYSRRQGFAFASQIGALLELGDFERRVDPAHLYEYLVHGTTDFGAHTLLAGVQQVPPGHFLEISLDRPVTADPVCYWKIPLDQHSTLSFEQAAEHLRELFLKSVKLHLRGDARVGATLSGGIDSSSIAAAMRHALGRDTPLHTFTYVASLEHRKLDGSEEPWADMAGRAAGALRHKVQMSPDKISSEFEQMAYIQDAPFSSPVLFVHHQVLQAAQQAGFRAVLSGQGPDPLFAGGGLHITWRAASLVRQGRPVAALQLLRKASEQEGVSFIGRARQALAMALPPAMRARARHWLRRRATPNWVNAAWFQSRGVALDEASPQCGRDLLRAALYEDVIKSNLPAALRFEDRNSASLGMTSRLPFLTAEIAEFAFSLPEEFLVSPQGASKYVFRRAMRGLVPDAILDRRDRLGFPVPAAEWLLALRPWVGGLLPEASQIPALNFAQVSRIWEAGTSAKTTSPPSTFLIWRWVSLIVWARRFRVVFY